jgi:hypothetical protein
MNDQYKTQEQMVWEALQKHQGSGYLTPMELAICPEMSNISSAVVSNCMTNLRRKELVIWKPCVRYHPDTARRMTSRAYQTVGEKWVKKAPKLVPVSQKPPLVSAAKPEAPVLAPAPVAAVHDDAQLYKEFREYQEFLKFKELRTKFA